MGDEPSNSELGRRLDDIRQMLAAVRAEVIGRPEYTADKNATVYRLGELERELEQERRDRAAAVEQERRERAEDVKAVHDRLDAQAKAGAEHRMHWRQLVWTGALPALATALGILVTWLISRGGH